MQNSIKYLLITTCLLGLIGCAALVDREQPPVAIGPELKWDLQTYADFVNQNIQDMNAKYARQYIPYEFIVDTNSGSTRVQNLIDPHAALKVMLALGFTNPEVPNHVARLHEYVITEYRFELEPKHWQTVRETIHSKKGDCKSLSLLLMSMLVSAGYECHAAISNGHMWVMVLENQRWRILEIDQDPDRLKIYNIPGFYDYPLYRIFLNRSEKRKKKGTAYGLIIK
jgi:hypothetical protein